MRSSIRTRVVRLERERGVHRPEPRRAPVFFWDVIAGVKNADELPADDRTMLAEWWTERSEESKARRLAAVRRMADVIRTECVPQGVPVPTAEALVEREDRERGFCAVEELLRRVESLPLI